MEVLFRRLALIFLLLLSCISAKAAFRDNQATTNRFTNGLAGQVLTSLGPTASLQWTTPSAGDSTNIWTTNASYIFPRFPTNAIHINRTKGGIIIGTNGIGSVPDSEVFRAVFDSTMGDPSAATWTLEANVTGSGTYGGSLLNVNTAGDAYFALYNHKGVGFGLEFNPNAIVGVTPFALNSSVNQTSGMLLSVSNFDVGKWNVAHNGVIWSATNRFAFGTITNVWPLTNAVAGQVLTSAGGAGAQMYWNTVTASGPTFANLVWTNDGGNIKPTDLGANTNKIVIYPNGSVDFGYAHNGIEATAFLTLDDSNTNSVNAQLELYAQNGDGGYRNITIIAQTNSLGMTFDNNGQTALEMFPTRDAGVTPYLFDTTLAHTSGNLNEWKNFGVTQLSLSFSNGIATPAITAYGAGSHPWQFGMATNTVNVLPGATNVVEIVVAGVAYLLPAKLK